MDLRSIAMGLAFAFMWSSAFASARIIVAQAPPLGALSLRFLISGLLALAIGAALGQSARLNRAQWRGVVIFGLCQNALYLGVNFVAMRWVSASFAAIVASTMPLLVALAGWLIFRERLRPLTALGLVAGMSGVALIMGTRLSGGEDLLGFLLCAIGVIALTAATLTVRVASSGGNLLMIVGLQMLVGAAALAPVAALTEGVPEVRWSASLVLAFAYTTLVPGLLATWIWFLLVGRIGAVRAATFHFLNPFFGVAVAAVLLGERMGIWDAVGVVVIAAGILAVQVSKMPERQAP
ncbi:DMT family transporter [Cereibacter sphaeroides]|uniref:DMT family transporter n=1 Tax=Cereibacter sphaeroides TaxID=1063 RepID=UPI001F1FB8DA|nr:DMT family transporter [Cereibacter sphaeroides]MCE6952179.1 DMT family transporter [Cereibacter sphaeroides]MCE6961126.1 DMT family transporter [Cereibacter sphaeroides]MCE6972177.1 DMT family transporter [Cereibacter sphaeroides]